MMENEIVGFADEIRTYNGLVKTLKHIGLIDRDDERLDSYDLLAAETVLILDENEGKWKVDIESDPIDDSLKMICTLSADNVEGQYCDFSILIVRFERNETNVYITFDAYLDIGNIVYRFDNEPAVNAIWDLSTTNEALFSPKPKSFIEKILKHNKLVVESEHDYGRLRATFDIQNLKSLVEKYNKLTEWIQ